MTRLENVLLRHRDAENANSDQPQEAAGNSEGSPGTEEQGMPKVVIHEKPIALKNAEFKPGTRMLVTDVGRLVLASGSDYAAVAAAGPAACEKHGYQLHETVMASGPSTFCEVVESPEPEGFDD